MSIKKGPFVHLILFSILGMIPLLNSCNDDDG